MRGFAVAAGGWDEEATSEATPLRLVEPANEPVDDGAPTDVIDLDEHRAEVPRAPGVVGDGIIYAW